jgi:UDPglucose--hexose-1-phosphate uridylyltransferase
VRVVPNLYPIVGGPDAEPGVTGAHEVAVLSPEHGRSFAQLEDAQAAEVLVVLRDRARHHLRAGAAFVQVVINHGAAAGASIEHPHAQLVALDFVPPAVEHAVGQGEAAADDLVLADLERAGDDLVVLDGAAPSWCPHAASTPFEFRVALRAPGARFDDADDARVDEVAQATRSTLARLAAVLGDVPYNLVVYTAPPGATDDAFHWYVEVQTRIAVVAGFEQGTGILVNTTPPELAASRLREA